MKRQNAPQELISGTDIYMPGISIDCVILGFYNGNLKVLLNRFKVYEKWMLPGGFIMKNEDLDTAANRILSLRTNLKNIYLRQFQTFGKANRVDKIENRIILNRMGIDHEQAQWYLDRFISCSYYALIEYNRVKIKSGDNEDLAWFDIDELPELYADHQIILRTAIETIRKEVGLVPIGFELLPRKFTMPELRCIYETIMGEKLDRRNFQRKMLSTGVFISLDEKKKIGAHKSPNLYSFDKKKYEKALRYGFDQI